MNEIAAIALQAMQQDMNRLTQVSNNLANLLTPGFKRSISVHAPITASFASLVNGAPTREVSSAAWSQAGAVPASLDTRAGTLRSTGQSLDLAIEGSGYLEVSTPQGSFFTRQGNLTTDAQGRVVTSRGHPVMGVSGEIVLKRGNPVIDSAGAVSERGPSGELVPIAQLKVVRFEKGASLRDRGDGLLEPVVGQPVVATSAEVRVKQGYLENANTSSMHEMVQLIQTMRHFESMQRVAVGYDEMMGTAIRKLGETN